MSEIKNEDPDALKVPAWPEFVAGEDGVDALVKLSRYYGQLPGFVIAGGGNTSFKTEPRLWVKASGTSLAAISREGFVIMDRERLQALAETELSAERHQREARFKEAVLAARLEPEKGQRPSVECLLHHLLPAKFVVHSHATAVNMLTCCANGERIAAELCGDAVLWVPFVDPGYVLGRVLKELLADYQKRTGRAWPAIVLMANHGLIVSGDTPEQIRAATERVVGTIQNQVGTLAGVFAAVPGAEDADALVDVMSPALRGLMAEGKALKAVTFDDSPLVAEFVGTELGARLAAQGPLNPDQIVYCNSFPMWFVPPADRDADSVIVALSAGLEGHWRTHGHWPRVVLAKGVGLFAIGEDYKAAATSRDLYKDAIEILAGTSMLPGGGGPTFLSPEHRQFIEKWEVEAYRKQVARSATKGGRVAGKIAMVTGAAQGFGLEIAQALAGEGATVALADVNADGARRAAADLCKVHGAGRAIGLAMNVTSGESIAAAVREMVRTYGGVDLLVSNAGVLKAESVKTQTEEDFDFVTAVNYKGYFLCVQKVSPVMATQHKACPAAWFDIVQINSKSGLQGSNKNGAYAGSKFGGVGLTQSFALELIEDGIKVNAICPGNFFDGPLWSDPDNGLFPQYLRTGKVPGAKTVADVKRFYEAKVPMGRGCTTADVMKAIYYLVEQEYETGQALPVTGGQVMLS